MKKRKTEKMFLGNDFFEIIEWLGIDTDEYDEKKSIKLTKEKIEDLKAELNPSGLVKERTEEKRLIDGIRTFTLRLSEKEMDHAVELWKGLYRIENDYTFLTYVQVLLEHMWY